MRTALVTGAAGFIGSHLCARLLREGWQTRGLDSFDPYYERRLKERNLAPLLAHERFAFHEADLNRARLAPVLDGADVVFHLAARAGVRNSWGADFDSYVDANIRATQRLLEALSGSHTISRLVFASSSSVYGEAAGGATGEDAPRRPISPYGMTKLAAEGLVSAYHASCGVPTVALRYFTVYGPGQRPDMAFHRFCRALLLGDEITVFGDGRQTRDFTYVDDVVSATLQAASQGPPGAVYNIGGGSPADVLQVIEMLAHLAGGRARIRFGDPQRGDPRATAADTRRARDEIGFRPAVALEDGLAQMVAWMTELLGEGGGS